LSALKDGLQGADDLILLVGGQKRMHWQAEDLAGSFFGFGEVTPFVAEIGKDRLFVEAFGIIDG